MNTMRFCFLIALLLLTPVALSAQGEFESNSEIVTVEVEQPNGTFDFSITIPSGWVYEHDQGSGVFYLATSDEALSLASSSSNTDSLEAGEVTITIGLPGLIERMGLEINVDPVDVVETFIEFTGEEAEVQSTEANGIPIALTSIEGETFPAGSSDIAAVGFDAGTILIAVAPGNRIDETIVGILNSIRFGGQSAPIEVAGQDDAEGETVTVEVEQPNGTFDFSIAIPAGWVYKYDEENGVFYLATSDETMFMASVSTTTEPFEEGEIAITIGLPEFLERIDLDIDADPVDVVEFYVEFTESEVDVQRTEANGLSIALASIEDEAFPGESADIAAVGFDAGTIIVAITPWKVVDETVIAILDSIRFGGQSAPIEVAGQEDTEGEIVTVEVEQPNGTFDFSIAVPAGWVHAYLPDNGAFYVATNDHALALASTVKGEDTFAEGEFAISIAMPVVMGQLGLDMDVDPVDAVETFLELARADGEVQSGEAADIPLALASATSERFIGGTSDVAAVGFDAGTILLILTPGDRLDETVIAILDSIRFGEQDAPAEVAEPETVESIRQWAFMVDGSSQYGSSLAASWGFMQAAHEPDTDACGDFGTAWAAEGTDTREILRLRFETPVIPTEVNIYQTFNPGAIVQVDVANSLNPDRVLPIENSADEPGNTECPGVFTVDLSHVDEPIDMVVIYLDQSITENWNEIDAVQLVGVPAE